MQGSSESRRRLVCRCLGVASPRIFEAVRREGLTSVDEVTKSLRAGAGCTTCHDEIEEILADVQGTPVDPDVRLENRLVCDAETRSRIEGSVDSLLRPRLAERGASIESVEIDGLAVRVRLGGEASEEIERYVVEKLRKYICADLEVTTQR
jgi:NifU-like protein